MKELCKSFVNTKSTGFTTVYENFYNTKDTIMKKVQSGLINKQLLNKSNEDHKSQFNLAKKSKYIRIKRNPIKDSRKSYKNNNDTLSSNSSAMMLRIDKSNINISTLNTSKSKIKRTTNDNSENNQFEKHKLSLKNDYEFWIHNGNRFAQEKKISEAENCYRRGFKLVSLKRKIKINYLFSTLLFVLKTKENMKNLLNISRSSYLLTQIIYLQNSELVIVILNWKNLTTVLIFLINANIRLNN